MKMIKIKPPSTIHLIGICGTGMGALAGLLKARGFSVTGSDAAAYPPISTFLKSEEIEIMEGYRAENLNHNPDLVVVGNVCSINHPEAKAARDKNLNYASLPQTVHDLFLVHSKPIVVTGTHGKTTTSAITAYLLEATHNSPSILIGGVTKDFGSGYKLGQGKHFVIEGDEYDSAYFEKVPKFVSYAPSAAIISSVEHDHIDIYPTVQKYEAAFATFAKLVNPGPLAVYSGDKQALLAAQHATCDIITYAVKGDPFEQTPAWLAKPVDNHSFELVINGESKGIFLTSTVGRHNLRNTLAALIMANCAANISLKKLQKVLAGFGGVARRQQIIARPNDITIYDDFAHHPTAVKLTLEALKNLHQKSKLIAAFEPKSATACRKIHHQQYVQAFDAADLAIIAPVGRDLPIDEKLDTKQLVKDLKTRGVNAIATDNLDKVFKAIVQNAKPKDAVVLLSNGAFGSLHHKLAKELK